MRRFIITIYDGADLAFYHGASSLDRWQDAALLQNDLLIYPAAVYCKLISVEPLSLKTS